MLTKSDYRYFEKAKQVAEISEFPKVHIGCVAVYKGMVIGLGCNCNKTHPKQKFYNRHRIQSDELLPKLHAEINCLNQLRYMDVDFTKVKLYIYRKRTDREYSIARPCKSCMAAIKDLGIRNIYYTTDDGFAHEKIA